MILSNFGCGTMNGARPLEKGEHEVGMTFGGPTLKLFDTLIPLPNMVFEGRSGLGTLSDKPYDINYGLNATALAFGIVQGHVGASWLMLKQSDAIPALSLTNRIYGAANFFNRADKFDDSVNFWGAHELEVTASWDWNQHLIYTGLAQYTDFGLPDLLLSPFVGTSFDHGDKDAFKWELELRWYAINATKELVNVNWFPETNGSLGINLGVSYAF